MKNSFISCIAVMAMVLCFTAQPSLAQQLSTHGNPIYDPIAVSPDYTPLKNGANQFQVITIDDYDNFKLGVDFAECSIANNPNNPTQFYAAWNSTSTAGGNGYFTNDGYTWVNSNPNWSFMWGDVVVVYDSIGHLAYQNLYGGPSAAKVAVSSDNGQSWSNPALAIIGQDKNWLAADQTAGPYSNNLYSSMTTYNGGNVSISNDFGNSWTNTNTLTPHNLPGMSVCVGPEGNTSGGALYAVTNSGDPFNAHYTFFKSTDGGQTFSWQSQQQFANTVGSQVNGRNAVLNTRTRPYPYIAADNSYGPHRGRLYLVYASNDPPGDGYKPDVYCRYSDDGAITWSPAAVVNDDANSMNNFNWFPSIWSDKSTGRLYITWMDTRDCPTSDSCLIYATYTLDGVTFMPNQKVSNHKMKIQCPECGGGETPLYQGDYNGIVSNSTTAMVAWTDMRDNTFGSYVGYFPDFACRATSDEDTLAPSAIVNLEVPDTKLFSDTVFVTADVPGFPGLFSISFPAGNSLMTFPGTVPIRVDAIGAVPAGAYEIEITAKGSNGTPVHKRKSTIYVVEPQPDFLASDTLITVGDSIQFTDITSPGASNWTWSFVPETVTFAGGTDAHSKNPIVIFDSIATYSVAMEVICPTGTYTISRQHHITVVDSIHTIQVKVYLEGLFNGNSMNKARNENGEQFAGSIADQVNVELHDAQSPYGLRAGPFTLNLDTSGILQFTIPYILNGNYYLALKHRNSIETWSSQAISFQDAAISYDFTDASSKAFGENLKPTAGKYLIYTGDVNQDGLVDSGDMIQIDNAASAFSIGYILSDLNGDGLVDLDDMILVDNNGSGFVAKMVP